MTFETNLAQPQAAGAQALAPTPSVDLSGAVNAIGRGLSIFGKSLQDKKKEEQQLLEQRVIGEFVRETNAINQGLSTGAMSSSQANTRTRAVFSKFAAAHPLLVEQFKKSGSALIESTELGEAAQVEKDFEAIRADQLKKASQFGIAVSDNMTRQELNDVQKAVADQEAILFAAENKRKQESHVASMNQEERQAFLFKEKQDAAKLLGNAGESWSKAMRSSIDSLARRAQAGEDPELLLVDLQRMRSNVDLQLTTIASTNSALAEPWKRIFDELGELGVSRIKGTLRNEIYEEQKKNLINRASIVALGNPTMNAVAGVRNLIGDTATGAFIGAVNAGAEIPRIAAVLIGEPSPSLYSGDDSAKASLDVVRSMIRDSQKGSGDKDTTIKALNGIVKGFTAAEIYGATPEKLAPFMNFVNSSEYVYALNNGMVTKEFEQRVGDVFRKLVEEPVAGRIAEAFSDEDVSFSVQGDKIVLGSGMETETKALNQIIRVGAHLAGSTDYVKYWEENKHHIFRGQFPDPVAFPVGSEHLGMKYKGGPWQNPNSWEPIPQKAQPKEKPTKVDLGEQPSTAANLAAELKRRKDGTALVE